jgi:RNA polymerase sigma-B factor
LTLDRGFVVGGGVDRAGDGQKFAVAARDVREAGESAEALLAAYRKTGERRYRNQVVEDHGWLASVIARSFWTGSEPLEDLVQVAFVALLKAAERFDPSFGVEFRTYAAVTARGELRRYYRDSAWGVRVPRRLQELRYEVRAATEVLRGRLHRSPTTQELAGYLKVEVDEIIDCLCADSNFRSLSIDRVADGGFAEGTPDLEGGFDDVESMEAFRELARMLPERLRRVVEMRFVDQMKQSDIAAELGVSQVQISRLLRVALNRLRPQVAHRRGVLDAAAG